ncbi:MAG: ATP synthase F0 subunit B [Candidatus Coatesbacteria bacterium]|nr:ATP synthase F0 subunit B [Candidatus Coatesbacteria bacterium]
MQSRNSDSAKHSKGFFKRSMIVVYILAAYLIINYAIRLSEQAYMETWKLANFIIFVGLLYWKLRKPLIGMIDSKIADVDEALQSTEAELQEAKTELADARSTLDGLDAEIESLIARARELGEGERDGLIDDGRERARNIVEQAYVTLQGREREIKQEIREELAERCVQLARSRIAEKLTPELHISLIRSRIPSIRRSA